jgi:hypothetical protein
MAIDAQSEGAVHTSVTLRAFALLAIATLSPACGRSRDGAEARTILVAYESFQQASQTDRPAALEALRAARCSDAAMCADRDACVGYATALMRATELAGKAHTLGPVDAGGNGGAKPEELAIIVAAADEAIESAEHAEEACDAAIRRLGDRQRGK